MTDFEQRHEARFKGVQFDWLDFQRDGQPFPVPNSADPAVSPPQEIFLNRGGREQQLTRLGLRPQGLQWNRDATRLLFTADSAYRDERRMAPAPCTRWPPTAWSAASPRHRPSAHQRLVLPRRPLGSVHQAALHQCRHRPQARPRRRD
ncbi:MAG: hypothetical protein IPF47_13550 [Gemmatimonadetes bacterium]|nr:hypothetical protein [Gemmatimonadota bacterium]